MKLILLVAALAHLAAGLDAVLAFDSISCQNTNDHFLFIDDGSGHCVGSDDQAFFDARAFVVMAAGSDTTYNGCPTVDVASADVICVVYLSRHHVHSSTPAPPDQQSPTDPEGI